jgi:hypothetical protein
MAYMKTNTQHVSRVRHVEVSNIKLYVYDAYLGEAHGITLRLFDDETVETVLVEHLRMEGHLFYSVDYTYSVDYRAPIQAQWFQLYADPRRPPDYNLLNQMRARIPATRTRQG